MCDKLFVTQTPQARGWLKAYNMVFLREDSPEPDQDGDDIKLRHPRLKPVRGEIDEADRHYPAIGRTGTATLPSPPPPRQVHPWRRCMTLRGAAMGQLWDNYGTTMGQLWDNLWDNPKTLYFLRPIAFGFQKGKFLIFLPQIAKCTKTCRK